jgi:hypothetical protein
MTLPCQTRAAAGVIRSIQLAGPKKFMLNTSWPHTSLSWGRDDLLRTWKGLSGSRAEGDLAGYSEQTKTPIMAMLTKCSSELKYGCSTNLPRVSLTIKCVML